MIDQLTNCLTYYGRCQLFGEHNRNPALWEWLTADSVTNSDPLNPANY